MAPQREEGEKSRNSDNFQSPRSPEPDIELTVTGEILNQPVFSPFRREGTVKDSTRSFYVINFEEIEAQGAKTIREALRFLPGIKPDGTVGTEVNALSGQFIRGSNSEQVLILIDGRPINNLGSGGFDLSEITTDNVERVEVLPGGGSTLYGSDLDRSRSQIHRPSSHRFNLELKTGRWK